MGEDVNGWSGDIARGSLEGREMSWISGAINFVITWLGRTPTPRREATIEAVAGLAIIGIVVLGLALLSQGGRGMLRAFLGGAGGAAIGWIIGPYADQGLAGEVQITAFLGVFGVFVVAVFAELTRRYGEGRPASTERP
jgi:hypothetical protein